MPEAGATPAPRRRRRRTTLVVAAAAVVLVMLGGGYAVSRITADNGAEKARSPASDAERDRRAAMGDRNPPPTRYPIPPGSVFVSPHGDDRAAGTSAETPLRTAKAALARASAGTTVVLRAGVYREDLGAIRKRVTIQPYPGERVWFSGTEPLTKWRADGTAWRHDYAIKLCQTCFLPAIIDAAAPLAGSPDMLFRDGRSLRQVEKREQLRSGTFWVDRAHSAVLVADDPAGRELEAAAFNRFALIDPPAAGTVIRGIGVRRYASNQDYSNRPAMLVVDAENVVIENSAFLQSASSGAMIAKPDAVIRGSVFAENGLVGVSGNRAHRIVIQNSAVIGNNAERFATTGSAVGAAGIKLAHTDRPTFSGVRARDNFANGIWCDLGCENATYSGNIATGNDGSGLYYEVSARATISSNVSAGNSGHGLKISSSDDVQVNGNTFAGNNINIGVYNDPRESSFDSYAARRRQSWVSTGVVLRDNLLAGSVTAGSPPAARIPTSAFLFTADYKKPPRMSAAEMVTASEGNIYLTAPKTNAVIASWWISPARADKFTSVTEFRAATGRERSSAQLSTNLDALFRDPAAGDFRLGADAPAAAKSHGANLPPPTR